MSKSQHIRQAFSRPPAAQPDPIARRRILGLWYAGLTFAGLLAGLASTGCDAPIDAFASNEVFARRWELTESIDMREPTRDTQELLEELFGNPNDPKWPEFLSDAEHPLVSLANLQRAAGAFSSDEAGAHVGLYREHCVSCHGIAGDGLGPAAALLNPYPRDFRMGKFKFKSTPIGKKPTRADLRRTLRVGIVGTSMPAFDLLDDEDVEALVDYVIYLSVRGEMERRMLTQAATELDIESGERLVDPSLANTNPEAFAEQWGKVTDFGQRIAQQWRSAEQYALEPPQLPPDFPLITDPSSPPESVAVSVARGQRMFQSTLAGCSFCHGDQATGDGQQNNFDDWTRDWTSLAGLSPLEKDQLQPMLSIGALKPRPILPRNLRLGVFRGGETPADLYTRIVNGIEGTPMPAVAKQPENPQGLSESEIWDVVNFLLSLDPDVKLPQAKTSSESVREGDSL